MSDHCIFVRCNGRDIMLPAEVEMVKADLKKMFEFKDLGKLHRYLGMTIKQNPRETIKVYQAVSKI
jgi:hypothetical protein